MNCFYESTIFSKRIFLVLTFFFVSFFSKSQTVKILFDASKAESAGNADWVVDADSRNLGFGSGPAVLNAGSESNAQRIPSPAQSGITGSTSETYWSGALSYWGIDCVNRNYTVESLPYNGQITYGNSGNSQDLSNYTVFIVCEPNILFTASEKSAIINFVQNGGGLLMVADHDVSDRNNDGDDSPHIWNDLMTNNSIQANPFGMTFDYVDFSQTTSNIPNLPADSILNGVAGSVTQVQFSGGTTMTLSPAQNSTVKGVVYKTGSSFGNTNVMVAYARYGSGKVAAIGDSSPCDDGTGDPNDGLFFGYTVDAGGNHRKLLMNMTIWLATQISVAAPVADFTGNPLSVCVNQATTFTNNSSGATNYTWNFGSGASPATANTVGPHSVTFSTSGLKTISLTVTGPGGSNTVTKTNYVTVNSNCLTNDLGVIAILSPTSNSCPTNGNSLQVTIQNFSTSAINFSTYPVVVQLDITDPSSTLTTFTKTISSGTLNGNASMNVLFTGTYNLALSGNYNLHSFTVLASDINTSNDDFLTTITIGPGLTNDQTIFSEDMGSVSGTTTIATHEANNGFQNDNLTMSGTADVRNTTVSSGYITASGGANIFFTTSGRTFIISGINTTGLSNLELSFGILKSVTTSTGSEMNVQVSTDGIAYTNLSFPALPAGISWNYTTASGTIPATSNLFLKFTSTSTTVQFRVDDIILIEHVLQPEICGNGIDDNCNGQIDEGCSANLNLSLLVEGFYNGGGVMRATVNALLYPNLCDTISVELHSTSSPYGILYNVKSTIDINGNGIFTFPFASIGQSYFIVVKHRNCLETWSAAPVAFSSATINYSFKDAINKAYGNNLKDLGSGNFALFSGDVNSNGLIDINDQTQIENQAKLFLVGYTNYDLTGNGLVESADFSLIENNFGRSISRP